MLASLVLMELFKPLGHDYDSRYLKQTILAFLGTARLAKNGKYGVFWNYG